MPGNERYCNPRLLIQLWSPLSKIILPKILLLKCILFYVLEGLPCMGTNKNGIASWDIEMKMSSLSLSSGGILYLTINCAQIITLIGVYILEFGVE